MWWLAGLAVLIILLLVFWDRIKELWYVTFVDDGYTCLPNVNVPVRIMPDGNIACMSTNGKDCLWSTDTKGCYGSIDSYREDSTKYVNPLVCGAAHKEKYGNTGYDYLDADGKAGSHWCQKGSVSNTAGDFNWYNRVDRSFDHRFPDVPA